MRDPAGYDEAVARAECDRVPLEIDDKLAFHDIEKLVVGIVLMPRILALHHAKPDD